jgi:hypothetical protein
MVHHLRSVNKCGFCLHAITIALLLSMSIIQAKPNLYLFCRLYGMYIQLLNRCCNFMTPSSNFWVTHKLTYPW